MSASWEGAIVRGDGPRKGRVLAEGRNRLTGEHRLLVHWEDNTTEDVARDRMTMLKPPIGFRDELLRDGGPIDRYVRSRWLIPTIVLAGIVGILAVWAPTVQAILDLLNN